MPNKDIMRVFIHANLKFAKTDTLDQFLLRFAALDDPIFFLKQKAKIDNELAMRRQSTLAAQAKAQRLARRMTMNDDLERQATKDAESIAGMVSDEY